MDWNAKFGHLSLAAMLVRFPLWSHVCHLHSSMAMDRLEDVRRMAEVHERISGSAGRFMSRWSFFSVAYCPLSLTLIDQLLFERCCASSLHQVCSFKLDESTPPDKLQPQHSSHSSGCVRAWGAALSPSYKLHVRTCCISHFSVGSLHHKLSSRHHRLRP